MSDDAAYRHALRDIVYDLIQIARTERLNEDERGTMFSVLGLIQSRVQSFDLDAAELGFDGFDAEQWYMSDQQQGR